MKLSQAMTAVEATIKHNLELGENASNASYLIPMLWSLPGEGKSTGIEDKVKELGMELITVMFGQFDAGELGGFPIVNHTTKEYERARPFFMPTSGTGVIFLDELPQAPVANQNIAAQLVNERRIGEHKLPAGWSVVCAGNPMSARAGTNAMPAHLKDRLTHLDIETDHKGFREYALGKGFLPEITGFINERPEWLQKFDPKQNASPSPRSWERVNSIMKLGLEPAVENQMIKGQIGEAPLADFSGFLQIWRDLPVSEEVIQQCETHAIPSDPAILYALCSSLAHKATKGNIKNIITFIKRFISKEFAAFLMRDALARDPELKKEKSVQEWFLTEGKELLL